MWSFIKNSLSILNQQYFEKDFIAYRQRNLKMAFNSFSLIGAIMIAIFSIVNIFNKTHNLNFILIIATVFLATIIFNFLLAHYIFKTKYKQHIIILLYLLYFFSMSISHLSGDVPEYYMGSTNFILLSWFILIPFRHAIHILNGIIIFILYIFVISVLVDPVNNTFMHQKTNLIFPVVSTLIFGSILSVVNNNYAVDNFQIQKKHQESEEKYKALVERANDGIVILQDGHIRFINQMMANILGYNVWDIINTPFLDYVHISEREKVNNYYLRRQKGEDLSSIYESVLIDRNNNNRPVEFNSAIITFMGKTATQVYIRDISERKKNESDLKESQERYRIVLEGINDGIFDWDLRNNEVFYSKRYKDILGFKDNEFSNDLNEWRNRIHPDDSERALQLNYDFISGKIPKYELEYRMKHKDGNYRWILARGICLRNEMGMPYRMCGSHMDITDRKRLEEELSISLSMLEKEHNSTLEQMQSYFSELQVKKNELLQLQNENIQSQFATLKNQINPHFLFNSLNVLASLISVSPDTAEKFTTQLAKIYRYVLEFKSEDLTTLKTELDFLHSYLYLLNIRFENKMKFEINIPENKLNANIVPLAVQLIVENTIKHNTLSVKSPLVIRIFVDNNNYLVIDNNLQKRERTIDSTGVGIDNIKSRYAFFTEKPAFFGIVDNKFVSRIPLL